MKPPKGAVPLGGVSTRPELFVALAHSLAITSVADSRWTVSVDGEPVPGTFRSRAEAWAAGVREADARSRLRSA